MRGGGGGTRRPESEDVSLMLHNERQDSKELSPNLRMDSEDGVL